VVVKAYFPGETNVPELVSLIKEKLAFIGTFLNVGEGYCVMPKWMKRIGVIHGKNITNLFTLQTD